MSVFRDLRIVVRQLSNAPAFTATAILMLALGIGATTAIFSIVEGVLLRPLPFPDSNRLVVLSDVLEGAGDFTGTGEAGTTAPDTRNYQRDTHAYTSIGGYQNTSYELTGAGDPAMVVASRMTGGVFPALQVQPLMGRFFTQQEDEQKVQVTVLSYAAWQTRFHGDSQVLGKKFLLDRKPYIVVGVMPRGFEFPLRPGHLNHTELWVPMSFTNDELTQGAGSWNFGMVGRLKPNITPQQAVADATTVAQETMRNYPAFMAGFRIHPVVHPLREDLVILARPLVRTLFLAVTVVLLIACANLAGLLLVRAIRRRHEIAVRLALGARASTLLWQAILESLVLSVSGGVLGLILAAIALHIGVGFLPETLPRVAEIGLDWQVVAFALSLAVLTGVLCGLAPAFAAIRTSVNDTLKEGGRTGTSGSGHARLRSTLVTAEIAIALVLLTASGLLLRSFTKMRQVDVGFQPDNTLVAAYSLPMKQYATQASIDAFNHALEARLAALAGVRSAGITSFLPDQGNNTSGAFVAEGHREPLGAYDLATMVVTEGDYLQAMGVPLLRGRLLTPDDRAGGQPVAVVNRMLAQQSWPGQDPIGKRVRLGTDNMKTPWATVVGEVEDVKEGSPDKPDKQQWYVTISQVESLLGELASPTDLNGNGGYIAIRTAMAPEQMENSLRATVRDLDPQLPLTQVQTMTHAISEQEAPRRFNTALIAAFATAAVGLAVLGIYSVMAFSVALRLQEMAIRMALGSQRASIVRLVLISGAKLAAIGCAIGLVGAFAASRLLRTFVFGVSTMDPLVLTLAAAFILLLTLAATLLPALRAARTDLTAALRSE
jgi:putative ABC transport system permease protein